VGVSLAVHAAAAVYLSTMRFTPPLPAPEAAPAIIEVPLVRWPPPALPEPITRVARKTPDVHKTPIPDAGLTVQPVPTTPTDTIEPSQSTVAA
jgi:hypothetical protein